MLNIVFFYRVKELFKSNQTRYGVSPVYLDSKTKTIFAIAFLEKKFVFQSETSTYSLILFSKIWKFHRVKELFKSNQTWYGVSPVYLDSKTKRISAIVFLEKKFVFQSEISTYSLILFSKILKFYWVKELSKSIQTRHGVSPVYLDFKTKKYFCYSLPRKKVSFSYGNLRISRITNFKKGLFHRVKELSKVNQTDIPDYQYYLGCNAKKWSA